MPTLTRDQTLWLFLAAAAIGLAGLAFVLTTRPCNCHDEEAPGE